MKVTSTVSEIPLETISGFVICAHQRNWWLGRVLQVESEPPLVTVMFLHPHGPCSSFKFPTTPDVKTLIKRNILTTVEPRTRTGRVYTLTKIETKTASEKLTKLL